MHRIITIVIICLINLCVQEGFCQSVTIDNITSTKIFCTPAIQTFNIVANITHTGVGNNRTLKFQISKGPIGSGLENTFDNCNQTSGFTATFPSTITGTATITDATFTFNASTFTQCGVYNTRALVCNTNTQIAVSTPLASNQITIIQPIISPVTVCQGLPILTCTTQGSGLNYSWSNGSTTNTTIPASTGTFTVTVTDGNGASCSYNQAITVNATPSIPTVTQNPSGAICVNQTKTLSTGAQSGVTFSWQVSSGSVSPTTGNSTTFAPTVAGTVTYTVTGTTANGCTAQSTGTFTVNNVPNVPTVTENPIGNICVNATKNLSTTAQSGVTFTWSVSSGSVSPSSGTSTTFTPSVTGNVTYTVTATNSNGCTSQSTGSFTVNAQPTVSISPATATICAGSNISLTASGASTYTWAPSTNLSATSGASVTASPTATITYTVTGSSGIGCTASASRIVTVNPVPTVTITPATASICAGGNISLTASGANTYTWSPSSGLSPTTGATVTANPTATTTYTVVGTAANGCTNNATRIVTVNPLPTISISPATVSICLGASQALTASGANTYTWAPSNGLNQSTGASVTANPTATTTYTVTGTSAAGCTSTGTRIVTINPLPTISISPATVSICSGASQTLTASGASTYAWSPSSGLNNTTGTSVTASPTVTTTYTVVGTSAAGCTGSGVRIVTVNPLPVLPTVTQTPAGTICTNQTKTLSASPTSNVTYTWAVSSGSVSQTSGSTVTYTPSAESTVTYTVTGTNSNGCTIQQSSSFSVVLFPTYNSASTTNPPTVTNFTKCSGETFNLKSLLTGANFNINAPSASDQYRYKWTSSNNNAITTSPALAANTYSVYQDIPSGNIDVSFSNTSNNTIVLTITLQLKRGSCEGSEITAFVLLLPQINPTATPANNSIFCNQESIVYGVNSNLNSSLNASTSYDLSISVPVGCTIQGGGTTANNIAITNNVTRSYQNSTTDFKMLTYTSTVKLTVNSKTCSANVSSDYTLNPSLNSIIPSFPDTICSGLNSTVTLSLLGTTTYNYDWFFNTNQSGSISCNGTCSQNNISSGNNSFTLNLTNAALASQQAIIHYDPVLPNTAGGNQGCHKANGDTTFTIVVLPIPAVTATPQKVNVCDNSNITIDLIPQTSGTPPYKFDWTWENATDNTSNPTSVSNPSLPVINATVQNLDDTKHVPISYIITPRFQVASPAATCTGTQVSVTLQVMPTLTGNDTAYVRCEKSETGNIKVTSNESPTVQNNTTYKWVRLNTNNVIVSSLWVQNIETSDFILPPITPVLQSNSTLGTAIYEVVPIYHLGTDSCEGTPINLNFTFNPAPNEPVFTIESSCIGQKNVYVFIQPSANTNYSWGNQPGLYNDDSTKVFIADPDLFGNSISLTATNNLFGGVKCSTTKSTPIPNQTNSLPYADMFQLTVNPPSIAVLYDVTGIDYQWHRVPKNLFNDNVSFPLSTISFLLSPNQNQAVYVFGNEPFNTNDNYYYVDYKTNGSTCLQRSFLNNVSNVTSTRDDLFKNFFKVYPNPASNFTILEIPYITGEAFVQVVDLSGRVLVSKQVFRPIETMDTSQLDDGLYIILYQSGNGVVLTQKLMIAR